MGQNTSSTEKPVTDALVLTPDMSPKSYGTDKPNNA